MRITVFGATGRTGRYILAEGLRRDHQLTAFTRWPAALVGPSTLAAIAMDYGRDPHAVRKATDGADAGPEPRRRGVPVTAHAMTGRDDVPLMSHVRPRPAS
jgi:putative NADH-flavin reductase